MKTIQIDEPFAVFSDVHGNLPASRRSSPTSSAAACRRTICLGDLVGYGPSPNEVALLVRDRGIPTLMGNYDQGIGFETGDCGCVYKTDEQRAEGAASLAWTQEAVTDEVKAYLRTLEDHFVLADARRRPARRARQPAAHQRVPLRGPAGVGHGAHGRRVPLPGHPLRPHARALRAAGRRDRPSSTSAAAGVPRTATGASATRSSTRRGSASRGLRRVRARPLRLRAAAARPGRDAADHELRRRRREAGPRRDDEGSRASRWQRRQAVVAGPEPEQRRPGRADVRLRAAPAAPSRRARDGRAAAGARRSQRHARLRCACPGGHAWPAASRSGRSSTTTGCPSSSGCSTTCCTSPDEPLGLGARVLRLRQRQGAAAAHHRRLRRRHRALVLQPAAHARPAARAARDHRQRDGRRASASSRPSAAARRCRCSSASSRPASRSA